MVMITSHWRKIYDFRDSCCPGYTLLAGRCIPQTEDPCSPGIMYFLSGILIIFTWNRPLMFWLYLAGRCIPEPVVQV